MRNYTFWRFCSLFLLFQTVHSRIYIDNETYASLPGLFGSSMFDGLTYQARLQFLHENPYLCDPVGNESSFVRPLGATIQDMQGHNLTLPTEPVILLASRGECPFQRKAIVAQSLDPSVEFLIVFNYMSESGEDTLVPMYSEFGDTRLVLLSVTHRGGQALKHYIESQPPEVIAAGGPILTFDSLPPEGLISVDDLREMLLSALGLFFMLISFSGCIMIIAGTYGHMQIENGTGRVVLTNDPSAFHSISNRSGLLTLEQVETLKEQLQQQQQPSESRKSDAGEASVDTDADGESDCSCAICIDEFSPQANITALPCNHRFHTECITPWLTERQAKCPLCKYDVLEYVLLQQQAKGTSTTVTSSIWNRLRRYQWSPLDPSDSYDEDRREHTIISPEEMMLEHQDSASTLELAEHHGQQGRLS